MSHKDLSSQFLRSLDLEQAADIKQTTDLLTSLAPKKLSQKGLAIINLQIESIKTGLGGRTIIELKNDLSSNKDDRIETGDIRVGDIVKIEKMSSSTSSSGNSSKKKGKKSNSKSDFNNEDDDSATESKISEGVITRISQTSVIVTVDEQHEENILTLLSTKVWIVKISNSITYKRMKSTLRKLAEYENLPSDLFQLLASRDYQYVAPAQAVLEASLKGLNFHNDRLNASQKHAINFSLNSPISIIHGPPGTGKTYTLIELITHLVSRGERVLVCGPSNISIDTILERLSKVQMIKGDDLLRIGHPARLLQSNLKHSLDIVSTYSDAGLLVGDIKKEIEEAIKKVKKTRSYREKRAIWGEVKELRNELRQREKKVTTELILKAKVVLSTLHGASSRELMNVYGQTGENDGKPLFDTLIIDEVSQSLEPQCWIPLVSHSGLKKLVLAGDNLQLPPTIKLDTNDDSKRILERTMFDRLVSKYGEEFKNLLDVQYRMNEKIMRFSSDELYQGKLTADESVMDILPFDLDNVEKNDITEVPLVWYDTQGGEYPERDSAEDNNSGKSKDIVSSKYNEMECYVVSYHLETLLYAGLSESQIGIIAPYNSQISHLKSLISGKHPEVEISTVDGFQGREKEVIILSLVRSNPEMEIGFLKDERRLNVAITRAKRQLCVVGDMEVMEQQRVSKFIKNWVKWWENNGEIVYPDLDDILQ